MEKIMSWFILKDSRFFLSFLYQLINFTLIFSSHINTQVFKIPFHSFPSMEFKIYDYSLPAASVSSDTSLLYHVYAMCSVANDEKSF